jgi:hypothetical protein
VTFVRLPCQSAWHGSGADFDAFDFSFMGTGEGNQAFGWGGYLSGTRDLAEWYRRAVGKGKKGQLYEANIREDEDLMDWDKPLSEQPEKVRKILDSLLKDVFQGTSQRYMDDKLYAARGAEAYDILASKYGKQEASKRLFAAGITGHRFLDGNSRGKGEGSHNYVIYDEKAIKILQKFYQTRGLDARGSFNPARLSIRLLENADLSTFLHESGHFFLDMYEKAISEVPADTPITSGIAQMRGDFMDILKWAGFKGDFAAWQQQSIAEKREVHEKFARGFEAYLREGKAPNEKMKGIFEQFKAWLTSIYKRLKDLNVKLTPEARAAMGRMLGTETGKDTGHAQPLSSLVLTPSGYRQMGDLAVGDVVMAANGEETTVEGIYPQGRKPVFRILLEDGGEAMATEDHLWHVREKGEEDWKTVPTSVLIAGVRQGKRYELPEVRV